MNRKKILLTVLVLGVAGWMVYQFHHSPEWRQFTWAGLWQATRKARASFLLFAVLITYSTYLFRTLRWKTLMTPAGRFWPVLKGTLIGFTGVALLGRPGELVRPYYIARKHNTEVSPQLAVWLLERSLDMSASVLLVCLALILNPGLKSGTSAATLHAGIILGVLVLAVVVSLYLFYRYSEKVLNYLHQRWKHSTRPLIRRTEHFLRTLAHGMQSLSSARCLLLSVSYTFMLWICVSLAIWLIVLAYPQMLPGFNFPQALLLLGFTLVGSLVQLPGVGGGVQATTIFGLTAVFGANLTIATSAGLLIWLISFYAVAPFGAALATKEGIRWRQVEHDAEVQELAEEEAEQQA
jgi:uncharacterized protein (TIRG00374 family)